MTKPRSVSPPSSPSVDDADLSGVDRFEQAFRQARRHSRRVRALKILLPSMALLLVAGFLAQSYLLSPAGIAIDVAGTSIEDGRLVMSNPELDGFTRDQRPYSMKAERATQDIGNAGVIDLERIDARLPLDSQGWAYVDAEKGSYDRDANTLSLSEGMTVRTENGMTAFFQTALIDIDEGNLTSSDPVRIEMDGTRIASDSITVTENGRVLIFENRVRMEIDGERLRTASNQEGAGDVQ